MALVVNDVIRQQHPSPMVFFINDTLRQQRHSSTISLTSGVLHRRFGQDLIAYQNPKSLELKSKSTKEKNQRILYRDCTQWDISTSHLSSSKGSRIVSLSPITRSMTKGSSSQPMGSTPHSTSNSSSNTASVMVTNASTLEEEVAGLIKVIEGLTQKLERQDLQISDLVDKVGTGDASQIKGKQVLEDNGEETSTKRQIAETEHTARELQISADGGIQVD
ncbi:hypothetical protein ACS0TY_032684 [Phlomoides rotata]